MMSVALYKDGVAGRTFGLEAAATTTAAEEAAETCQGCYLVDKPGASACETWGNCLRAEAQLSPIPK